jgi:predicted SAM-dependent methyltransferase
MWRKAAKALLPGPIWFALRQLALEVRIARLHRRGVRQAGRLRTAGTLRLNLGSGDIPKEGWINVDLFGSAADLRLDLRRPLPFPDDSASYIYTEHFFEHLEYPNVTKSMGWDLESDGPSEALQFLRECKRVLAPGGILDVVVPDAEGMIGVYVARGHSVNETVIPWWGPAWCKTALDRVNYLFRQGRQHKYAYDEETLTGVLQSVGFRDIRRRPFDPGMDAPNHVIGSLCMTATKSTSRIPEVVRRNNLSVRSMSAG